jgi:hypothetical protein
LGIANVDTQRFYKYETDVYKAVLYEKHMERLNSKLEELKEKDLVFIDDELLNQLDLVESKKSNNITMFVRKNFTGEEVVPGVDLKWFNLNSN